MPELITCARCDARWGGLVVAHCGSCHRTFSTARLFDLHRHARGELGGCLEPATVTSRSGERIMFFRDGMWRNPEMPAERRERVAALAAEQKAARIARHH